MSKNSDQVLPIRSLRPLIDIAQHFCKLKSSKDISINSLADILQTELVALDKAVCLDDALAHAKPCVEAATGAIFSEAPTAAEMFFEFARRMAAVSLLANITEFRLCSAPLASIGQEGLMHYPFMLTTGEPAELRRPFCWLAA